MKVYAPIFGGEVDRVSVGYCSVCGEEMRLPDAEVDCPKCHTPINSWSHEYYSIKTGERLS